VLNNVSHGPDGHCDWSAVNSSNCSGLKSMSLRAGGRHNTYMTSLMKSSSAIKSGWLSGVRERKTNCWPASARTQGFSGGW